MFGYFKMNKDSPKEIYQTYRKYYCYLCLSLEKHYGEISRFMLSYDVAVLLMLFCDDDFLSEVGNIRCFCNKRDVKDLLNDQISMKIASLHILLIAAKLEDDISDENKISSKLLNSGLSPIFNRAKKMHPYMWEILCNEYSALRQIENKNGTLEALENQFSKMMKRVVIEIFNVTDPKKLELLDTAAKWLYFIDAVDDIDENIDEGSFNPLSTYKSSRDLCNKHYIELSEHFNSLYAKERVEFNSMNMVAIDYVVNKVIPVETMTLINKLRGDV